jgi:hypothetical protein
MSNDQRQSMSRISCFLARSRMAVRSSIVPLPGPTTVSPLHAGETAPVVCIQKRMVFPPLSCSSRKTRSKVSSFVSPGPRSRAKVTQAMLPPLSQRSRPPTSTRSRRDVWAEPSAGVSRRSATTRSSGTLRLQCGIFDRGDGMNEGSAEERCRTVMLAGR